VDNGAAGAIRSFGAANGTSARAAATKIRTSRPDWRVRTARKSLPPTLTSRGDYTGARDMTLENCLSSVWSAEIEGGLRSAGRRRRRRRRDNRVTQSLETEQDRSCSDSLSARPVQRDLSLLFACVGAALTPRILHR
jgi:hypothetical protein